VASVEVIFRANKRALLTSSLVIASGVSVYASTPPAISFTDSFEGVTLYPYWSLATQNGTIGTSTNFAYSGSRSLRIASRSGGDRSIVLKHNFGLLTKGVVSIAFYDAAPGEETLYEQFAVYNSKNPAVSAAVGTMDFDSECYMAGFGTDGPNALCGIYPQMSTAPVKRTAGWHVLTISYGQTTVSISIDGKVVFVSTPGNYQFDTIQISVSGPSWRPDTTAYFDNFQFTPLTY